MKLASHILFFRGGEGHALFKNRKELAGQEDAALKHAKFRRSESGLYAATWSQTSLEGALQARGEGTALSLWIVVHSILEVVDSSLGEQLQHASL